jgi:threonine dehydrogenase-like Zn-dependent dehydrogenase
MGGGLIGILMLKLALLSPVRQIIVGRTGQATPELCLKMGASQVFYG